MTRILDYNILNIDKQMTRKIRIKESVYKRATKAIETLKSAKEDVNDIQKKVWNLKNKLKQR